MPAGGPNGFSRAALARRVRIVRPPAAAVSAPMTVTRTQAATPWLECPPERLPSALTMPVANTSTPRQMASTGTATARAGSGVNVDPGAPGPLGPAVQIGPVVERDWVLR